MDEWMDALGLLVVIIICVPRNNDNDRLNLSLNIGSVRS